MDKTFRKNIIRTILSFQVSVNTAGHTILFLYKKRTRPFGHTVEVKFYPFELDVNTAGHTFIFLYKNGQNFSNIQ